MVSKLDDLLAQYSTPPSLPEAEQEKRLEQILREVSLEPVVYPQPRSIETLLSLYAADVEEETSEENRQHVETLLSKYIDTETEALVRPPSLARMPSLLTQTVKEDEDEAPANDSHAARASVTSETPSTASSSQGPSSQSNPEAAEPESASVPRHVEPAVCRSQALELQPQSAAPEPQPVPKEPEPEPEPAHVPQPEPQPDSIPGSNPDPSQLESQFEPELVSHTTKPEQEPEASQPEAVQETEPAPVSVSGNLGELTERDILDELHYSRNDLEHVTRDRAVITSSRRLPSVHRSVDLPETEPPPVLVSAMELAASDPSLGMPGGFDPSAVKPKTMNAPPAGAFNPMAGFDPSAVKLKKAGSSAGGVGGGAGPVVPKFDPSAVKLRKSGSHLTASSGGGGGDDAPKKPDCHCGCSSFAKHPFKDQCNNCFHPH